MAAVPAPGDVIAERFRIEAEIGRGGMGVVLRGRDGERAVAIKVLLPEAVENAEAVARFVNEARAARELTSAHCVRVYDVGSLDGGLPFMVMELLEGTDLGSLVEKQGPMSVADACDAIIEACDALAEAHARGMVHRDVKPANLFAARAPDGTTKVKVLDFGVSKLAATMRAAALTSTGTILGSPHYMAPEQLKSSKGVDLRADVWSLGVVLYELLTAKLPFQGSSFGELFMHIVSQVPEPPTTHRKNLPPGLVEIITRCLEKDREKRYADVAALVAALARFASPKGADAARRIVDSRDAPAPPPRASVKAFAGTMLMANAPPRSSAHMPVAAPIARAPAKKKASPAIVIAVLSVVVIILVLGASVGLYLRAR